MVVTFCPCLTSWANCAQLFYFPKIIMLIWWVINLKETNCLWWICTPNDSQGTVSSFSPPNMLFMTFKKLCWMFCFKKAKGQKRKGIQSSRLFWRYSDVRSSLLSGWQLISGHKDSGEAGSVQSISWSSVRNLLSCSWSSAVLGAAGLFPTRWWYRSSSCFPVFRATGSPSASSHSHPWTVLWKYFQINFFLVL